MISNQAYQIASALIQHFEGRRLAPYRDIRGIWTYGNGNTTDLDGNPVTAKTPPLTEAQCDELRERTIRSQAFRIAPAVKVALTDHQWGASLSLAWNIGSGAFLGSTVLRLYNQGMVVGGIRHFVDWCHVDGALCAPLLARRRAEAMVAMTSDISGATVPAMAAIMAPKSALPIDPLNETTDDLNAASLAAAQRENPAPC